MQINQVKQAINVKPIEKSSIFRGHRTKFCRPFLKWAGGKTQLLNEFNERLPASIKGSGVIKRYIEPFLGGGAMFFFLKRKYDINESFLFDINKELIMAYKVIQKDHKKLIDELNEIEHKHLQKSEDERKEHYYTIRDKYNKQIDNFDYVGHRSPLVSWPRKQVFEGYNEQWVERTCYLLFLNKTCFNGLFRQNRKGEFNVPFGRYKNPKIYDEKNITEVNKALKNTEIFYGDFTISEKYIEKGSFVYLDPPYRPLNKTSNFTSYSKDGFVDEDQIRLAMFFEKMDKKGAYLMLSNSDPKNKDSADHFFDDLYREYNIKRIPARRYINCDASKRGELNELIITNYAF